MLESLQNGERSSKILLVSHQLDHSGAPNALLAAARCLRRLGYQLDLYSLADGPLELQFRELGVPRVAGVDPSKYALMFFNTAVTARFALSLQGKCKYVLWLHESPNLFVHSDVPFFVAQAAEAASALLFPSQSTAEEWAKFGSLRQRHCPIFSAHSPLNTNLEIGWRSSEFDEPIKRPQITLLTIDPVEYFRGYGVLARALRIYTKPPASGLVELIAVGANAERIAPLFAGLSKVIVQATDRIPKRQVIELMARSDLYLSNSSYATQNLGLCEAASIGIPALISDIPVHREFAARVPSSVVTYELFCPTDLVNKLDFMVGNLKHLKALAQKNQNLVREIYSDEQFIQSLVRLMLAVGCDK
jgi:hypothetical protein